VQCLAKQVEGVRAHTSGQIARNICASGHSARRSRLVKISSHVASIRIGAPQIRIDNGARSVGAKACGDSSGPADGFTWLLAPFACPSVRGSARVPRGESTTCRMRGTCWFVEPLANQHFVPSRPGSRSRHVA